ncbi:hypothetical protein EDB80DRAFT_807146 [Ilyonectria destructans]|nr:hypothetical protein EDB80DRAFT_807146 [Ilyonectria destructans]
MSWPSDLARSINGVEREPAFCRPMKLPPFPTGSPVSGRINRTLKRQARPSQWRYRPSRAPILLTAVDGCRVLGAPSPARRPSGETVDDSDSRQRRRHGAATWATPARGPRSQAATPDTDEEASATCCTPYVSVCTSDIVGLAGCMSECQSAASILLMYLGLPNSSLHGPYWDDRSTTYRNREVDYRYRRCATMAFVFDPIKGGRGGIGPFQTPWRYGRPPARRQMVLGRAIPQHEIAQLCPYPAPLTHTLVESCWTREGTTHRRRALNMFCTMAYHKSEPKQCFQSNPACTRTVWTTSSFPTQTV